MKKVLFYVMCLPMVLGILASCASAKADVKNLEGRWTIVEVNGEKIDQERMPYIEFNMAENKVHGNGGCNTFNTAIKPDANDNSAFTLGMAASTMMACPNMNTESKIFQTLDAIKGVKAGDNANQLLLVDGSGKTVLMLKK